MTMTQPTHQGPSPICVAALYRFAPLSRIGEVRDALKKVSDEQGIKGTLLLAGEGINGTIAGSRAGIDRVLDHIRNWPGFSDLDVKFSSATTMPFHRMMVRVKQEIVTMGQPDLDPASETRDRRRNNEAVDDPGPQAILPLRSKAVVIFPLRGRP